MDLANLGLSHALSFERREDGVDFHCVVAGLAAARVSLRAVGRDVIRVRITPGIEEVVKAFSYVAARPVVARGIVGEDGGRVTLSTGRLTVEAVLDPWQLRFRAADGRLLTQEVRDDVNFGGHRLGPAPGLLVEGGGSDPARRTRAVVESLLLHPEDHFFGGGERFSRLDHIGRTVVIWQRNPYGARSELAYKNIPLLVGTRGYGVFVDVPTAVTFHVGSRSLRTLGIEAAGAELDYYLIAGAPKEILSTYTELTGRPAVPPAWAFGLWASTFFIAFTESSVLEHARRLRAEGIPCDVFHLDCFWQRPRMWCDFEWDLARIPDPKRLLDDLHRAGFRTCVWINPYVSVHSALYAEGARGGYFLRRPDGSVYEAALWSQRSERGMGLCAIVDFTHPGGVAWFREKLERLLDVGVDAFKPDFGEEVPAEAVAHDGRTGDALHNPYPLLYQQLVFDTTRARAERAVIWGRSAAPGCQRFPGHWSGDPECTFEDLAATLRGGLAAAMSGLAYWSHDIGGFWGEPSPELYVRWAQCGLFSPLARYHGATGREPWRFGPEALEIFRRYARLRSRLVPYLLSYAWEAAETGVPLLRPMALEFADDPAGYAFDLQYCLGRELLVSPVVDPDGWVTTYLPGGRWRDWWSGTIIEGPTTLRRQVPLAELPLYLRGDSLIVLGPERNHVGERAADPLTVWAFVGRAAEFVLRDDGGRRLLLRLTRDDARMTFSASEVPATWVLRVPEAPSVTRVIADGRTLAVREGIERADEGWARDGRTLVVKVRAREIHVE